MDKVFQLIPDGFYTAPMYLEDDKTLNIDKPIPPPLEATDVDGTSSFYRPHNHSFRCLPRPFHHILEGVRKAKKYRNRTIVATSSTEHKSRSSHADPAEEETSEQTVQRIQHLRGLLWKLNNSRRILWTWNRQEHNILISNPMLLLTCWETPYRKATVTYTLLTFRTQSANISIG